MIKKMYILACKGDNFHPKILIVLNTTCQQRDVKPCFLTYFNFVKNDCSQFVFQFFRLNVNLIFNLNLPRCFIWFLLLFSQSEIFLSRWPVYLAFRSCNRDTTSSHIKVNVVTFGCHYLPHVCGSHSFLSITRDLEFP